MSGSSESGPAFRRLAAQLDVTGTDDPFERAGRLASVAFASFACWVASSAEDHDVDAIYGLSREGPLLAAVLERVSDGATTAQVLEVSRVSTFLPSMPDFSTETMMRMWERFPLQSPRSMLAGVGLDPAAFEEQLDAHGLSLDVDVHEPWADHRVRSFLDSAEFREPALRARDDARALLLDYLAPTGMLDHRSVALVDVGWRGTIQDSLARLLPSTSSIGLLMALRPADLPQYENTMKFGFVAGVGVDGTRFGQELRMAASPLEMLCTGQGGTTTGYRRNDMGATEAIRRPVEREEAILSGPIARFQQSMIASVDLIAADVRALAPSELRPLAMTSLKSVLFDPDPAVVAVFEDYQLDPSIGGQGAGRTRPSLSALARPDGRQAVKAAIQDHGWPHALLKRRSGARPYAAARRVATRWDRLGRWLG